MRRRRADKNNKSLSPLKGLVKLKKIQKSEKNSDWSDNKHPPPYPTFFFFWNVWKHENNTKNTEKDKISPKKLKYELGLDPPTHFRVFLGFFVFLPWQNPLVGGDLIELTIFSKHCTD